MTAFEEMGIMTEIGKAVEEMEWMLPTDIQSEAIPLILGGGDVLMAAETGSGKTGAFCLPILQIVWETIYESHSNRKKTLESSDQNKWRLSPTDREVNLSLSPDGMSAQSKGDQRWQGCRANYGVKRDPLSKSNRFYFEVQFTDPGLARIGWSLSGANLELGLDARSWGYGGTAKKSSAKNFENYGQQFGDKFDVIGNIIDLDANTISWTKNGSDLGIAFRLPKQLSEQNVFFPAICVKNAGVTTKFSGESCAPNTVWVERAAKSQISCNSNTCSVSSSKPKSMSRSPKALIVEPSRELAQQTYDCINSFKRHMTGDIKQALLVGGVNARDQMDQLAVGVDIVVGTPGRIQELLNSGNLSLESCRFFVIDEVDALLQQGNQNLLMGWHSLLPRMFDNGTRLQMIVCSATLHNFDVKKFANSVMFFPTWVDLKGEDSIPETVHHVVYRIDPRLDSSWKSLNTTYKTDGVHSEDRLNQNQPNKETLSEGVKRLKSHYVVKAIDRLDIKNAIIFCRTKVDCDNLEDFFNHIGRASKSGNNYSCVCLHSDRKPHERNENLNIFKQGKCNFLICTDVAARGIDIKGIPFVIQLTLPDEKSNYLHRIGRVGRAERMGLAISLVSTVPEKVWYHSNCRNKGKGCYDTRLVEEGGCCIWYNEFQILSEIEDHLNCIIETIDSDFKIQVNQFDGKVTYGAKSTGRGYQYADHVQQMANEVKLLSQLETSAQNSFLKFYF